MTTTSTTAASQRPIRLFRNKAAKIAAIPMILTALVVFMGGTIWTIVFSFTKSRLLPRADFVGLDQYERLWSSSKWMIAIENLIIFGLCSLVFSLVIGFVLAALLDQKIRFENTFRTIILYPFALSFIVTGLVWQWILNPDFGIQHVIRAARMGKLLLRSALQPGDRHLWHSHRRALAGHRSDHVLMLAGLRGIDEDIWKAARVDGIPAWKTYIFIVIPMMRPVFVTALVIIASGIIRVYDLVVAQTSGGPGIASEVPAKYVYDACSVAQNLGQGFAASTMMLLAVLSSSSPGPTWNSEDASVD
jgi:glucose/mannose transport system permease protein